MTDFFGINELTECGLKLSRVSSNVWKTRCVVCGDSKKSKTKKRFIVLVDSSRVYCHNCSYSSSIKDFIKNFFPDVYRSQIQNFLFKKEKSTVDFSTSKQIDKKDRFKLFMEIGKNHGLVTTGVKKINYVQSYLEERKLVDFSDQFWFISDFSGAVKEVVSIEEKNTESNSEGFDPRLIIPFFKKDDGSVYMMQGRSLINKSSKYLTFVFDETKVRLFNFYNVDRSKRVYLFEGPIDSMFVENSMAMSRARVTKDLVLVLKEFSDLIIVLDNDSTSNPDVRKSFDMFASNGFKMYVPPRSNSSFRSKDVNDMIKNGATKEEVKDFIDSNVCTSLVARTKLSLFSGGRKKT